jgi:hypothetical protein
VYATGRFLIDRIISISKDSLEVFQGYLTEVGILLKGKNTDQEYYRQIKIKPATDLRLLKNEMDSLDLLNLSSQSDLPELPLHQPFSIYVVEFKTCNQFNTFRFNTYYPYQGKINKYYAAIERIIFDEFDIRQYFKFRE